MRILIMIALAAVLSGCYSIGNRDIVDSEIVAGIVSGTTAKSKVEELLGKPTWLCFDDGDQAEWHYCYTITTPSFRQFIPLVALFAGPNTTLHTLTLRFDENGVVSAMGAGEARSKDTLQGAGQTRAKKKKKKAPSGRKRRGGASRGRAD